MKYKYSFFILILLNYATVIKAQPIVEKRLEVCRKFINVLYSDSSFYSFDNLKKLMYFKKGTNYDSTNEKYLFALKSCANMFRKSYDTLTKNDRIRIVAFPIYAADSSYERHCKPQKNTSSMRFYVVTLNKKILNYLFFTEDKIQSFICVKHGCIPMFYY